MTSRFLTSCCRTLIALVLGAALYEAAIAQSLPMDVGQLGQLSAEQRAKALQALGQSPFSEGGGQPMPIDAQARSTGNPPANRYAPLPSTDDCVDSYGVRLSYSGDAGAPSPMGGRQMLPGASSSTDFFSANLDGGCLHRRGEELYTRRDSSSMTLKPFGYDLFSTAATSFTPATDIPVPEDYVIGPGDTLRVQLFGNTNQSFSLMVNRDGIINFPKLGPITVAGQAFDDVRQLLQDRLAKQMIGVQASITLGELRSIRIFLLGDVNQPGSFTVSSLSTITNALVSGGGVSLVGTLRNIELKRAGRTVRSLDLYDLLLHGDSSHDERLQSGDVIFVPPVGARVSVGGEVKRPAIYELKGETRLADVLALAGGVMASTSTGAIEVTRYDGNRKSIMLQLDAGKASDLAARMQDGDYVRLPKLTGPIDNHVRILGYVRYPGSYEWSEGYDLAKLLKTAEVLPSETGKETYLALGLIERTSKESGVRVWSSFSPYDVLSGASNPKVQRDDLVLILSRNDIAYLDSRSVHEVASGGTSSIGSCAGLRDLAHFIRGERATRSVAALSAEKHSNEPLGAGSPELSQASETNLAATDEGLAARPSMAAQARRGSGTQAGTATPSSQASIRREQYISLATGEPAAPNAARLESGGDMTCPPVFELAPGALPYLLDQAVAVYGEVTHPGLYPVLPKTSLQEVIGIAGGRRGESDATNIEYVSYDDSVKTGHPSYQHLDLARASQLEVGPGDILDFRPIYAGREVGTVIVGGEFKFPASYGILRGEHLSQLMQRAGGLIEDAYPAGAIFTRVSAATAERAAYQRAANDLQEAMVTAVSSGALGKEASLSTEFINKVIQRLQSAPAIGRVVINADPAALQSRPDTDPILEPGDAIFIPKRPISVTVTGQVLNPGTQEYQPALSVKQYIKRAGGFTQGADEGRTFVILPNGSARGAEISFWHPSDNDIPPGSVIVVPRDAAPFNLLGWSDRIFGVLSQMAVTAAALNTITK